MSAEKKIALSMELYDFARKLKESALRDRYSDLTDREIQEKLRQIFLYARS